MTAENQYGFYFEENPWVYDYISAMMEFCTVVDTRTNQEIPIIYPPERAFADKSSEVILKGKKVKLGTLPLPYMSLVLQDLVFDPSRYSGARFRKMQYTPDYNQVYGTHYPQPYTYVFQLDIRHRTNLEFHRILQAFHQGRINNSAAYLNIPLGVWGQTLHRIEVEGPVDNSDLEPGDNRDRALRKTYTLNVQGWFPEKIEKANVARKFVIEFRDELTQDLISSTELI